MTSTRRHTALAVASLAVVSISGPAGAAPSIDPTVTVDRTGTTAGETLIITGGGWEPGSTLIVELCGHGGLRGSVDCDVPNQRTAGVSPDGSFVVGLTSDTPPVPCPCVVKATDQASQIAATASIAVAGIATVPITAEDAPALRSLEITSAHITGGKWAELFGAGGRRVVEITLLNTGALAIDSPDVSIAWGTGSNPDGFVSPPETRRLEPGETETLTVSLNRPLLTIGQQTAIVEVHGLGDPVTARATTSGYPWGLLVMALVALQLVLLRLRNRARGGVHRRQTPEDDAPALTATVLELPAGPVAIDLSRVDDDLLERSSQVIDLEELELEPLDEPQLQVIEAAEMDATVRASDAVVVSPSRAASEAVAEAEAAAAAARDELAVVERLAREALVDAVRRSDVVVAASEARMYELEDRASARLQEADRLHVEAAGLLEATRARTEEMRSAAARLSAQHLADATSDRHTAAEVLREIRAERDALFQAASEAIDEVLVELDEHVQAVVATAETIKRDVPHEPAPRLGGLDARLAAAVSKAFASVLSDEPPER